MKVEDIKQEAQNRCDKRFSYLHNSAFFDGFVAGAEWRINSVWHNVSEKPKNGEMILALRSKYSPIICGPYNFDWEETVEVFVLKKWAYVEDLMPEMEG